MATNSQEAVLITLGGKPPNRREKISTDWDHISQLPLRVKDLYPLPDLQPHYTPLKIGLRKRCCRTDMRARSDYPI